MVIAFESSPRPTVGVELELELVDRDTRELASQATQILEVIGRRHSGRAHPRLKHELLECTIEVVSGVCETVAELRADLAASIDELASETDARGLGIFCAGTHPFSRWQDQEISPDPRYRDLVAGMGWVARRLQIFGIHVHVGVPSGEHAIVAANALTAFLPHFLALSASSPYWEGVDTEMASVRSKVFEALPTAGLPEALGDWAEFEAFMETMVNARAIGTVREVWWDVRPHPDFGTVELRVCDGIPVLDDAVAVAALAQCVVASVVAPDATPVRRPSPWVLRQNKWRAARHGLDADLIVDESGRCAPIGDEICQLVGRLDGVAVQLGCTAELRRVLDILERGSSADRQRRVVAEGGRLVDVVDQLVSELEDR